MNNEKMTTDQLRAAKERKRKQSPNAIHSEAYQPPVKIKTMTGTELKKAKQAGSVELSAMKSMFRMK
jgi:hypothetical protein